MLRDVNTNTKTSRLVDDLLPLAPRFQRLEANATMHLERQRAGFADWRLHKEVASTPKPAIRILTLASYMCLSQARMRKAATAI